jgi:putative DNA primase/helicase
MVLNPGSTSNIIHAYPNGIGEKYADRDDLDKEIARVRVKTATRPPAIRPMVRVRGGGLPQVIDEAETHLLESDHELYQRGSLIVRPVQDFIPVTNARQIIGNRLVPVRQQHMRETFSRAADFQKFDRRANTWFSVDCPRDVAEAYLEREGKWRLSPLMRVISAPTLRPDGSVLEEPGYDEPTGLLYEPQGVAFPRVPTTPNAMNVFEAATVLLELIKSFPFVDEPSRAVAISAILTSLIRPSLPSAPLHAFTAPTFGSSKSLLMDVASMIATGHETPVMAQGRTAEEFEKRLGNLCKSH